MRLLSLYSKYRITWNIWALVWWAATSTKLYMPLCESCWWHHVFFLSSGFFVFFSPLLKYCWCHHNFVRLILFYGFQFFHCLLSKKKINCISHWKWYDCVKTSISVGCERCIFPVDCSFLGELIYSFASLSQLKYKFQHFIM